jgi:hypothetical protein
VTEVAVLVVNTAVVPLNNRSHTGRVHAGCVTVVPTSPLVGVKDVIEGSGPVKLVVLFAVPLR